MVGRAGWALRKRSQLEPRGGGWPAQQCSRCHKENQGLPGLAELEAQDDEGWGRGRAQWSCRNSGHGGGVERSLKWGRGAEAGGQGPGWHSGTELAHMCTLPHLLPPPELSKHPVRACSPGFWFEFHGRPASDLKELSSLSGLQCLL